MNLYINPY